MCDMSENITQLLENSNIDHELMFKKHSDWKDDMAVIINDRPLKTTVRRRRHRKKKVGVIARPLNCFMLFRVYMHEYVFKKYINDFNNVDASKAIGKWWKQLTPDERKHWENLAKLHKEAHAKAFPGYKFCPKKMVAKNKKRKLDSLEDDYDFETAPKKHQKLEEPAAKPVGNFYYQQPFQYDTSFVDMYNNAGYMAPPSYLSGYTGYSMPTMMPSGSMHLNSSDMLYPAQNLSYNYGNTEQVGSSSSAAPVNSNSSPMTLPNSTPNLDASPSFSPESVADEYNAGEPSLFYALPTEQIQQQVYVNPQSLDHEDKLPEDFPGRTWSLESSFTVDSDAPEFMPVSIPSSTNGKYASIEADRIQHLLGGYSYEQW